MTVTTAVTAENWAHQAACRGLDTEMFFQKAQRMQAGAICRTCPNAVFAHCPDDTWRMPARVRNCGMYRARRWWPSSRKTAQLDREYADA